MCLQCYGGRSQRPLIQLAPLHIINYQYGIFTSDSIVAFTIYGVRIKFKIKVLTLQSTKTKRGGYLIQDCGSEWGALTPCRTHRVQMPKSVHHNHTSMLHHRENY